ncbi:MAG: Type IV pilus biogenesis protein PilO [uncultured Thiotrichaceae bacterium]|uniref:Type IV pilus biogenesis protein PilO n=1 Tax=uncultured Thiotrichaceae bacterium TaxID=298394 RepID=A0A6S6S4Y6_9GAMM|nr:MAG: Type IV pilus biogenesis protein PilO [uncultured Thiotrichaceae bacterium]
MNLQDINNLAEDPGSAGWPIKALALLLVMALILFLGYKLVIIDSIEALQRVENKETELRATFEQKQRRASQLKAYEAQLSEMQRSFGNLMQQLPSRTEIPSLIIDISEKGVSNGLEIVRFEPLNEVSKEFYAEKPIKLIALGTYKELATFVSDISGLPRIVTIHNISLNAENDNAKAEAQNANTSLDSVSQRLRMEALIKTYRYLEDSGSGDELLTKK